MATSSTPLAPAPVIKPEDIRAEFDLPSGKHVVVLRGKGRDLRLALMAAGRKADSYRIIFAQISRLALFDGKRMPLEALDELDWDDAIVLMEEGGKVLVPLSRMKQIQIAQAPSEDTAEETAEAEEKESA